MLPIQVNVLNLNCLGLPARTPSKTISQEHHASRLYSDTRRMQSSKGTRTFIGVAVGVAAVVVGIHYWQRLQKEVGVWGVVRLAKTSRPHEPCLPVYGFNNFRLSQVQPTPCHCVLCCCVLLYLGAVVVLLLCDCR
jgi:hypothetical protein